MMLENFGSWWKDKIFQSAKKPPEPEQLINQSKLRASTNIKDVEKVLEWFEQFNQPPIEGNIWWRCQTALVEGFTNAVRHAHKNLPSTTPIELEVKVFAKHLEIRIWDCGQPFDLLAKLNEILQNPPLDPLEKEGGRGLIFMKKLTDEIAYNRGADQRNCLVMRKNFD
ncbi:ATP-binding protein [Ancylothrix sp. C2]|uniref:ATP-binding protein n=1 Tax=Ancylothrix sp. D3o TaxID=2953691 RepID=UPI0021BA65BB|nr:ATP-binding protein [Ancylothrix sp. D3o]MCT7950262.1 ATP-binding protein [Ancylothrix sp. D3o]